MDITGEIARRRSFKDHRQDFDDSSGRTHSSRKQDVLSSSEVLKEHFATPRRQPFKPPARPMRTPRAARVVPRSAKDTKMASLSSDIF